MKHTLFYGATVVVLTAGCTTIKTEHRVEPIEINVNVRVQVDRKLDDFFGDLDAMDQTIDEDGGAQTE